MPGRGNYALQPLFVKDFAELAVEVAKGEETLELDAVGPEVYRYEHLLRAIRASTGAKCLILPAPKWLAYAASKVLSLLTKDIVITKDEIEGLSRGLLTSKSRRLTPGNTWLSDWLKHNGTELGRTYANEVKRHYR